ncbi:hypothetical protein HF521_019027 [Silurus meridionalis]|uniref:Ig-like domain-containing protein n=1 Tax=Silurus meridionalis TaxID=175797 RepID=A0A8T0BI42_SILME|nr:hypothetical protein HF521_019027 [Silurus meridionalis]
MDEANIVGKETDTVTLKYSYESSSSDILLSWYIQYSNSALHFLFNVGDSPTDIRFEAESTSDSTELTIRYLKHSDSALYHCALRDAADISIKPEETTLSVTEGSNTTLSCTYTGSGNTLHWYQQKPGSRPEFLLLIDETSEYVREAQPPHPGLSIKLDKMYKKAEKKVDLHISSAAVSDSALYYCALTPTVTGNPTPLYKKHYT